MNAEFFSKKTRGEYTIVWEISGRGSQVVLIANPSADGRIYEWKKGTLS